MQGVNKVILVGTVGKDPELRYTSNSSAVCGFSLAVNRKGKNGEETDWFNVTAWEKAAETINQYVKKGSNLYIEGRLRNYDYDKDGQKVYRTEVVVQNFTFLPSGKRQDDDEPTMPF